MNPRLGFPFGHGGSGAAEGRQPGPLPPSLARIASDRSETAAAHSLPRPPPPRRLFRSIDVRCALGPEKGAEKKLR